MQTQMQKKIGNDTRIVWHFDPSHSSVEFSVRKLIFLTVKGRLTDIDGAIVLNETDMGRCSCEATIKADTIDTGNGRRDAHLRAPDFLDAIAYPNIQFQSSQVGPGKDRDMLAITGSLTIKETSRDVVLNVTEVDRSRSPRGEEVIYYIATTELDRFDFGINHWRGVIGRTLKVVINVQASRPI